MLIYKTPARIIYDTDDGSSREVEVSQLRMLGSLSNHYQALRSDRDILKQLFGDDHPIWVDFGQSNYWVCEIKENEITMSADTALRIMLQIAGGRSVLLTEMAEMMGIPAAELRAELAKYETEYLAILAKYYAQRNDPKQTSWQVTDERFQDSEIEFHYAESLFITKKLYKGIL